MESKHASFSNQNFNAHYTKSMLDKNYDFYDTHIHDSYEIYYFIQGDVNYHIEGHNYQIEKGDLLLINNKEIHRPKFNSDKLYERLTIHFAPWHFNKFSTGNFNILDCFENREPGHNNLITSKKVEESNSVYYLNKIIRFLLKKDKDKEIMLTTLLVQLLYYLNKINRNTNKKNSRFSDAVEYNEKVTEIIKYINNNLNQKFTLEKLAKKFYLDKYYLSHLFKENTSFSVFQYINYKKIMKAKELLIRGFNCSQVADKLNFGNYSNFYKIFKKEIGISPSEYQKDNKN